MPSLSWELKDPVAGRTQIRFEGDIVDGVELDDVLDMLHGDVSFDLGGIRRINSAGVKGWVTFMRQATEHAAISLERCSPAIVLQLSMTADFGMDARVVSVLLPFACGGCGAEHQHLLTAAAASAEVPESLPCPDCAEAMELDDAPESYLAVLKGR